MVFVPKQKYTAEDLKQIIALLRGPNGCPWDRAQTHKSIRANLLEEAYEVAEAIDNEDASLLQEELGDLLLQIALHACMEQENGNFSFDDVCDVLCKKLVFRHPHVFGDVSAKDEVDALKTWEQQKNIEKGRVTAKDRLQSVPATLPALMRAEKTQKRAEAFGFSYKDTYAALMDLESEIAELKEAMVSGQNIGGELGDVLFSCVNVARHLDVDAEESLSGASRRFEARVICAEELADAKGVKIQDVSAQELDALWKQAKQKLS